MDAEPKTCCSPSRGQTLPNADSAQVTGPINTLQDAVPIPSGAALIGTNSPLIADDGEGPLRRKKVRAFQMSATTITNASFSRFVEETAYVTEAERFGWSFVFFSDVAKAVEETRGVVGTEWWRRVDGANWRDIYGPNTAHLVNPDHPVVQVSWADATAFAKWCGGALLYGYRTGSRFPLPIELVKR